MAFEGPVPEDKDSILPESEKIDFAEAYVAANPELPIQEEALPEAAFDVSEMDAKPADEQVQGPYYQGKIEGAVSNTRETVKNTFEGLGENLKQRFDGARNFLSRKNLDTFEGLGENAKKIATSAYETVYKIPGLNRLVAKGEIAFNQMWVDKREEKLALIEAQTPILKEQIADKQANIDAARQLQELFAATSPEAAKKFTGQILNQEMSIAAISAKLNKNTALIENQQAGIQKLEAKRNAVAERMIGAYDEHIEPIKYQEALIENQVFDFKESVKAKEVELSSLESTLAQKESMLAPAEALAAKQTGEARRDSEKIVQSIRHEIEHTRIIIEHTRHKAQIEIRGLEALVKKQEAQRAPYEERQKYFKNILDRKNSFTETETGNEVEVESTSREEEKIETPPTDRKNLMIEMDDAERIIDVEFTEIPPDNNTDELREEEPTLDESIEKEQTIGEFVKGWNEYVTKGDDVSIPKLERDKKMFQIDEKSFIDDARTPGFHAKALIKPDKMAEYIIGRLKRQIRASRSYTFTSELHATAEAAVKRFFTSIENK